MFYSVIYLVIKQTVNSVFNSFCSISTLNHPFRFKYFPLNSGLLLCLLVLSSRGVSAVGDLRLISFEASKGSSCCCRFGNPVTSADTFKLPLSYYFHGDSDLPIISSLRRAVKSQTAWIRSQKYLLLLSVSFAQALSGWESHIGAETAQRKRALRLIASYGQGCRFSIDSALLCENKRKKRAVNQTKDGNWITACSV